MNFPAKTIVIVMITVFALLHSSISYGKEVEPNITGEWVGSAFLHATVNGFSSSKDAIKVRISQQEGLKFKGNVEKSFNGKVLQQDIQGYIDRNKHNICLVDQKNRKVIIGYVSSNEIMKLYCWDNIENNKITVYILRKTEGYLILNNLK